MSKKKTAAAELLASFAKVASRLGLRWYVFGAQAVIAYGRPRATGDVDVTIDPPARGLEVLLAELRRAGFEPADPELRTIVREARMLPLRHRATGMGFDVVLAGPGLEQEFLRRSRRLDLGGLRVPVISVEDLLVTKILAGRPKDLDDARGILRVHQDRADLARVRGLLRELDAALDRSDLLPGFEAMLQKPAAAPARKPAAKPGRRAVKPRKAGR